jgi:SAM-dependent methyltransferase
MEAAPSLRMLVARFRRLRHRLRRRPAVGRVRLGSLQRTSPISRQFGFDRGQCVDRLYIERFLGRHADDIRGRVLEVADSAYTVRFGGPAVTRADVLHVRQTAGATVVLDLGAEPPVGLADSFDCIILTQTLQFVFDLQAAVRNLCHLLKPGGVLLATFPGISQLSRGDLEQFGEYWRLTTDSATRLFAGTFRHENLTIESHGNVLAAIALLHGLAVEDLNIKDLEVHDADYEVIVTVRAIKTG